jgi:hypothetical protein
MFWLLVFGFLFEFIFSFVISVSSVLSLVFVGCVKIHCSIVDVFYSAYHASVTGESFWSVCVFCDGSVYRSSVSTRHISCVVPGNFSHLPLNVVVPSSFLH